MQKQLQWSLVVFAGVCTGIPVMAQLGLGNVTGSAGSTVGGTVNGAAAGVGAGASAVARTGIGSENGLGQTANGSRSVINNLALATQLTRLLPAATTLPAAAAGFRNEGEFISAVHAAHNLNIPFDELKASMAGRHSLSLGQAIQKFHPDLDGKFVKDSVALAHRQSDRDIRQASSDGRHDSVAAKMASDGALSGRVMPLLPSGMGMSQAAAGFRNEEQFLSTLHAADNEHLSFVDLKDRVTAGQSLNGAIHDMKPGATVDASASGAAKAEAQSKHDRVEASASAKASTHVRTR